MLPPPPRRDRRCRRVALTVPMGAPSPARPATKRLSGGHGSEADRRCAPSGAPPHCAHPPPNPPHMGSPSPARPPPESLSVGHGPEARWRCAPDGAPPHNTHQRCGAACTGLRSVRLPHAHRPGGATGVGTSRLRPRRPRTCLMLYSIHGPTGSLSLRALAVICAASPPQTASTFAAHWEPGGHVAGFDARGAPPGPSSIDGRERGTTWALEHRRSREGHHLGPQAPIVQLDARFRPRLSCVHRVLSSCQHQQR